MLDRDIVAGGNNDWYIYVLHFILNEYLE